MSRHRNVRNLDINGREKCYDVLDEDDYYDEYDDEALDEGDLNEEDRAQLEDGLVHVRNIVGNDIPVSDAEIKELLWDSYFDRDKTVEDVLAMVRKIRAEEEKQKKKAAKKAKDSDRKPRYRRRQTPKTISDTIPAKHEPSLQQQPKSLSSLSSLALKSTLIPASKKPSSLQSLAQKSAGQRGMTALQMLASRQQQQAQVPGSTTITSSTALPNSTTATVVTTATTSKKPSSSLAALAQTSTKTKTTNLAHLAMRSRPVAGASIAKPNSLAGLAYRAKATRQASETKVEEQAEGEAEGGKAIEEDEVIKGTANEEETKETAVENKREGTPTHEVTGNLLQSTNNVAVSGVHNPLCALPSAAANFLFMRIGASAPKPYIHDAVPFESIGQAFYEVVKASSDSIHAFAFDVPSPDDVVMDAQSHRSGGHLRKS
ncbi:hypothetical protein BX666DRAFT_1882675 [Dichotomocladium elegans]|nr:hypothetical protein BX666DRAFT_1882675 [Dichotomocladium elegans]